MATTAAAVTAHDTLSPPASSSNDVDAALHQSRVLRDANALLAKIGFGARQFERFEDLVASVSSMSVALYEKLFQLRLERIVRVPRSLADYEGNAQLVVDALAGALLEHSSSAHALTGASLCAGDTRSIARVVRMFEQVLGILEEASSRSERMQLADVSGSHTTTTAATKRLIKKKTKSTIRTAASRARQQRQSDNSDGSDSGCDDHPPRRPLRTLRERELPPRTEHSHSAANLYETSDVSITRSRGGTLAARNSRASALDDAAAQQRRGSSDKEQEQDIFHARSSDVAAKKRSRRLSVSPTESPEALAVHPAEAAAARRRRPESKKPRSKTLREGAVTKSTTASSKRRTRVSDPNLLETQRYGRFVPVATVRLSRKGERRSASSSANESEQDDLCAGRSHRHVASAGATEVGCLSADTLQNAVLTDQDDSDGVPEPEEQMYFGGVSSVSNGSRSDGSVHFIEEDDTDTRDFSTSRVGVDLQNVPPPNTLSPSNAYDGNDGDVDTGGDGGGRRARGCHQQQQQKQRSRRSKSRSRSVGATQDAPASGPAPKSRNQEDGEPVDTDGDGGAIDPAPRRTVPPEPRDSAPKLATDARKREAAAPLYPLLPKTSAATSKSQTEFQRYKLFLKDHLQDLRQREFCQRQHMERAYKVGEHAANVERIRARRFQQDVRLQRIAIGLETRNEEETHLRQTLAHILALEKARLRDEHRATSSALKQIQQAHAQRESALETFYANQIELVKEQTHREVQERELVEKAHRLASEQLIREMRREREQQVAALLREQQHLEEARRFRTASTLARTLERGDDARARGTHSRADAFYTAAMRARELNAGSGRGGAAAKTKTAVALKKNKVAAAYSSVRPAPALHRRAK